MSDGLISGATLSPCAMYRYRLWRCWDTNKPMITFIGLNPSTANAFEDDNTIRKCMKFAKFWNFGGIWMINLFAYRTKSPDIMKQAEDPIGSEAREYLDMTLDLTHTCVAAWGNHGEYQDRANEVLSIIREKNIPVKCLGKNKNGTPKHPLYLKSDTPLIDF